MNFQDLVHQARRHSGVVPRERRLQWAAGQEPEALFITCSDSRVIPSAITGAEPGKLFELRTAGNAVPEYRPDSASSEMATIEYAVLQLGVPEIVVCGHSHCGAVTALTARGAGLERLPAMRNFLGVHDDAEVRTVTDPAVRSESQQHVRDQLEVLERYPFIRERMTEGRLRLHGWFFEIDTGGVLRCPDERSDAFLPL